MGVINNIIASVKKVFSKDTDVANQKTNNTNNESNLSIFSAELKKEQLNNNKTFNNDTNVASQATNNKCNRTNLSVFANELKKEGSN